MLLAGHIESEPGCLGGVGLQWSTLNDYVFAEVVGRHRLSNTSDNRDSWTLLVQVSLGGCQQMTAHLNLHQGN